MKLICVIILVAGLSACSVSSHISSMEVKIPVEKPEHIENRFVTVNDVRNESDKTYRKYENAVQRLPDKIFFPRITTVLTQKIGLIYKSQRDLVIDIEKMFVLRDYRHSYTVGLSGALTGVLSVPIYYNNESKSDLMILAFKVKINGETYEDSVIAPFQANPFSSNVIESDEFVTAIYSGIKDLAIKICDRAK